MDPVTPQPDAATSLALEKLADITLPPPVSWMPQTWGWAVLALLVAALAVAALLRWHRHQVANRYRREALVELTRIEQRLGDRAARAEAIAGMSELLKRVALAAWPRAAVASLSGAAWIGFLRQHGGEHFFPQPAARLLDDLEYRSNEVRAALSENDARLLAASARRWIEGHIVSA